MYFKNYDEFVELIKSCGFKCVEADYNKSTPAPYLVYFKDEETGIYADGEYFGKMQNHHRTLHGKRRPHKRNKV